MLWDRGQPPETENAPYLWFKFSNAMCYVRVPSQSWQTIAFSLKGI
eukprot:COSAG06_NODE_71_length_25945_cov_9.124468_23_plen_46_part_00